eukprot:TRINITY_DN1843_c0_g1_i6.p1 TRINITY_DN1843_c0_g1~~TRINITY_DN1843_c0_g1_i6.p1  ORF type:complete len:1670 (-),score=287.80 TRINITY_DN1843_c0_g1_i6:661-5670(-)
MTLPDLSLNVLYAVTGRVRQPQQLPFPKTALLCSAAEIDSQFEQIARDRVRLGQPPFWCAKALAELDAFDRVRGDAERRWRDARANLLGLPHNVQSKKTELDACSASRTSLEKQRGIITERLLSILSEPTGTTDEGSTQQRLAERELFRLFNHLPALAMRPELEEALTAHSVVVVRGSTGSGKSTQLPQYIADMSFSTGKHVICTQPRQLAAFNLAKRVASEYSPGSTVGEGAVGYVGGAKMTSKETRILYMTETALLSQLLRHDDKFIEQCAAVVVDEAHERNLSTDVLLGILKTLLRGFPHLKLVVSSATLDIELFKVFFPGCGVVEIPGKLYPVDVVYHPASGRTENIVTEVLSEVKEILERTDSGHVLCFLTGQEDVERATWKLIQDLHSDSITVCGNNVVRVFPLYGRLPGDLQAEALQNISGARKVIFATDVAETSLTIDGVKFVVDSGVTKDRVFDPSTRLSALKMLPISQASAEQRKGRAGRTCAGCCVRLYSEADFSVFAPSQTPQLLRLPLNVIFVTLLSMGIDPASFEWLEQPSEESMNTAREELLMFDAIRDCQGVLELTEIGKTVASLQADPGVVLMLWAACKQGFGVAACTIAGLISVLSTVFVTHGCAGADIFAEEGDILRLFKLYHAWDATSADQRPTWCLLHGVDDRSLGFAAKTAVDLQRGLTHANADWLAAAKQDVLPSDEDIQRLAFNALMLNVAFLQDDGSDVYKSLLHPTMAHVPPSSTFNTLKKKPRFIVYAYILKTAKVFAFGLSPIKEEWLLETPALQRAYDTYCASAMLPPITGLPQAVVAAIQGRFGISRELFEKQFDCVLELSVESGSITAWAKDEKTMGSVANALKERINREKQALIDELGECLVAGGARLVFRAGGTVACVLQRGQFIAANVQVAADATDQEIQALMAKYEPCGLKYALATEVAKIVRVLFKTPDLAAKAVVNLKKEGVAISGITYGTSGPSSLSLANIKGQLVLSWAMAPSKGNANLVFASATDANDVLRSGVFPNVKAIGIQFAAVANSKTDRRKKKPQLDHEGFFCVVEGASASLSEYKLFIEGLSPFQDEVELATLLSERHLPSPVSAHVHREPAEAQTAAQEAKEIPLLKEIARLNALVPQRLVLGRTWERDLWWDLHSNRAGETWHMEPENIEHILEDPELKANLAREPPRFSQPFRVEVKFMVTLSVHESLRKSRIGGELDLILRAAKHQGARILSREHAEGREVIEVQATDNRTLRILSQQIEHTLATHSRLFEHANRDNLFTPFGLRLVQKLQEQKCLHCDLLLRTIRLFGTPTEMAQTEHALQDILSRLKSGRTEEIIVKRGSFSGLQKRREALMASCDLQYLQLNAEHRTHITVYGTVAGIAALRREIATDLAAPAVSGSFGCGICGDEDGVCTLVACSCHYCGDCIRSFFHQTLPPFPLLCPLCKVPMAISDIARNLDGKLDSLCCQASAEFLRSPNCGYCACPQPECTQLHPLPRILLPTPEQKVAGGSVVSCDVCCKSYCLPCSQKVGTAVVAHVGATCADTTFKLLNANLHVQHIRNELLSSACPGCKSAFLDFSGCCAVTCEVCKAQFCGLCLGGPFEDAHPHVRACPCNPKRNEYFAKQDEIKRAQARVKRDRVITYIRSAIATQSERQKVLDAVLADLRDLAIDVRPCELV